MTNLGIAPPARTTRVLTIFHRPAHQPPAAAGGKP